MNYHHEILLHFSEINALTSFAFGIVAIKGFELHHWMGPSFLWLMGISIMNHMKHEPMFLSKSTIRTIDKVLAHYITIRAAYNAIWKPFSFNVFMFWLCLLYTIHTYYISGRSHYNGHRGAFWHGTVHIISSIGCLFLLRG